MLALIPTSWTRGRLAALASIVFFAVSLLVPLLQPPLAEAADPSKVNMIVHKNGDANAMYNGVDQPVTVLNCSAKYITGYQLSDSQVSRQLGSSANQLFNMAQQIRSGAINSAPNQQQQLIATIPRIAFAFNKGTDLDGMKNAITYLSDHINKPISAINLAPGDTTNQGQNFCGDTYLLAVGPSRWIGMQYAVEEVPGKWADTYIPIIFQSPTVDGANTNGQLTYAFAAQTNLPISPQSQTIAFTVAGTVDGTTGGGGGSGSGGQAVTGNWLNVAQIQLTNGEVYQKFNWDNQNIFFLVSVADSNSTRSKLTWNQVSTEHRQIKPFDLPPDKVNCVPFLFVHTAGSNSPNGDLNFNEHSIPRLQSNANSYGSNTIVFYDFAPATGDLECTPVSDGNAIQASIQSNINARTWLFYNRDTDSFKTVFSSGNEFERPQIGTYTHSAAGIYLGGGNDKCKVQIDAPAVPPSGGLFDVNWNLIKDDACNRADGGPFVIQAQAVDKATFDAISANTADSTTTTTGGSGGLGLDCSWSINPLTWVMCPLIDAAKKAVDSLDKALNDSLTIDTKPGSAFDEGSNAGKGLYGAWNAMRIIALSLLVIVALVMVISQAISVGPFDAYTVKKVLPRIVIAVIGISLSWQLTKLFIGVSNDLGNGVGNLIAAPFIQGGIHNATLNGGALSLGAAGIGAFILGSADILIVLSLALTALGAVVVAFAVITFRNILAVLLVILAPIAILLWILPGTNKGWKLWYDNFLAILLAFPIIIAFITAGRVFAAIASASPNQGIFQQIIIFIAYFGPYFALPAAFRLAGGFIATVGGVVNDRSKGFFDKQKKFRSEHGAHIRERAGTNRRYSGHNRFTRLGNTAAGWVADPLNSYRITAGTSKNGLLRRLPGGNTGRAVASEIAAKTAQQSGELSKWLSMQGFNQEALTALMKIGEANHGKITEAGLNEWIARYSASSDTQEVAAASQLAGAGRFLPEAWKSEEYGRANIIAAAGLAKSQQGFMGTDKVYGEDEASHYADVLNEQMPGLGDTFKTNSGLLNAQAGGSKVGYSEVAYRDPETGQIKFRAGGSGSRAITAMREGTGWLRGLKASQLKNRFLSEIDTDLNQERDANGRVIPVNQRAKKENVVRQILNTELDENGNGLITDGVENNAKIDRGKQEALIDNMAQVAWGFDTPPETSALLRDELNNIANGKVLDANGNETDEFIIKDAGLRQRAADQMKNYDRGRPMTDEERAAAAARAAAAGDGPLGSSGGPTGAGGDPLGRT